MASNTLATNNTIPFQVQIAGNQTQSVAATNSKTESPEIVSAKWLQRASKFGLNGIYELKEDRLTYCFAQPGEDRPKTFKVAKGSGYTLVRLKRFLTGEEEIARQLTDVGARIWKDEIGWITSIHIENVGNTDGLLLAAKGLKKLYSVSITDSSVSAIGFRHLAKLPALYSLTLKSESHPVMGIEALAAAPSLRDVSLRGRQIDDHVLRAVSELKRIHELDLEQTSASSDAVENLLRALPTLVRLDINGAQLEGSAWAAIADMRDLKIIGAARSNISDEDLATLRRAKQLTGLLIQNTTVSDQGFAQLAGLTNLDFLRIDGTRVTDESLKLIARSFPNLGTLYIRNLGPGVSDSGLKALGQHPVLNYVHVSKGKFSQKAIEAVRKVRKDLRVIE